MEIARGESSVSAFRQDHCSLEHCDLIFMGPVILNIYFKTGLKDPGFYHAQSWKWFRDPVFPMFYCFLCLFSTLLFDILKI